MPLPQSNSMMKYLNKISFPFGYINIYSNNSDYLCRDVLFNSQYDSKICDKNFNVFFGNNRILNDNSYRGKQLATNGIYLGHHLGKKAKINIIGENISIYILNGVKEDYDKIFWNFVLKYILTYASLITNSLHFKGVLIKQKKSQYGIMILGKGGDGKTTLSKILENHSFITLSNTHIIIHANKAYGINTWIRERHGENEIYQLYKKPNSLDCNLKKIFIYHYNTKNMYSCSQLNKNLIYNFLNHFSNAIIAYDLKEEVFDYMADDFQDSIQLLSNNDVLLKDFIQKHQIEFLTIDTTDKKNIIKFLNNL